MTSQARFLSAMAATVTGVDIVTTNGPAGRFGITVSSMVSVSADPPLLLVSINRRSPVLAAILENGVFGVNVLGVHHDALADTFAGRPRSGEPYDFGSAHWQPGMSGVPLLADAAAQFECRVSSSTDAGTHAIVLGTVHYARHGLVPPLAYARRGYARPAELPARVAATDASPLSVRHPLSGSGR
jgi:flavin reductase (DIM6/NTAB) family NADH-FMN oxidoreductase RutF